MPADTPYDLPLTCPIPSIHILAQLPQSKSSNAEHIGRPRNAFMIFRKAYQQQMVNPYLLDVRRKVPAALISKTAGRIWRAMSTEDQEPWNGFCRLDKAIHEEKYPNYKFSPQVAGAKRKTTRTPAKTARKAGHPYNSHGNHHLGAESANLEPFHSSQDDHLELCMNWCESRPDEMLGSSSTHSNESSEAEEWAETFSLPAEDWMGLYWNENRVQA